MSTFPSRLWFSSQVAGGVAPQHTLKIGHGRVTSSISEAAAEVACRFRAQALRAGARTRYHAFCRCWVAVGVCLQLEPPSAGSPRDHKEQGAALGITRTAYEQDEILGLLVTQHKLAYPNKYGTQCLLNTLETVSPRPWPSEGVS